MSAAHGLTRLPAAPAWPRIGREVSDVLDAYPGLGPLHGDDRGGITWHAPRPFAATARVETTAGPVFVKRHHPALRSVADLEAEHRFAAHLSAFLTRHRTSDAAPPAIATARAGRDGHTARLSQGWVWEVLPSLDGIDRHRETLSWEPAGSIAEARAVGAACAWLHRAASGFDAPARAAPWLIARLAPLDAPDPLAALLQRIATDDVLSAALAPWPEYRAACRRILGPPLSRLAAAWRVAAPSPVWVHGDLHLSNLLWDTDAARVAAVLDFGLADRGCALFDLATAIERNAIAWLDLDTPGDGADAAAIGRPHLARAILDGYHRLCPLGTAERTLLAALLPVVHVGFALSEIGYFHALRHDPASVALAYDGFLLAHAAWFDGADGAALLRALLD